MPYNDPYGGGLLSGALNNPLLNFGIGLLSAGPSLTPRGPFQGVATGLAFASQAQKQAQENELIRAKLAGNTQEQEALAALQAGIADGSIALPEGIDPSFASAVAALDPSALSKFIPTPMTAGDQAQLLNVRATLAKLEQDVGFGAAETTTPAGQIARSVETLADVFDAAETGGNPFAPGGMFYKEAPLGKFGVTADAILGLPDALLSQYGDPAEIRRQAQQAQLIDKETSTISRGLQQLGQKGSGRSATAIEQMQTSLGEGNVGIPVRRKVIASTLETVIDDLESKNLEVPPAWYTLRDRLNAQTRDVGKGVAPAEAAPPPGLNPSSILGYQNGQLVPQPAPQYGPLPEATPTPAPAPRKVGTLSLNTQGQPVFARAADANRAAANGLLDGYDVVIVGGKPMRVVPE